MPRGRHRVGRSTTKSWSLGIARAEALYQVRGALGDDPTEPRHSANYPFPPVPDEPAIVVARERMKRVGLHPFAAAARRRHRRVAEARGDAMGRVSRRPRRQDGRRDLRSRGGARASQCDTADRREGRAAARRAGRQASRASSIGSAAGGASSAAKLVVLSAGAVKSGGAVVAVVGARRRQRSDMVGRHFMNHNTSAVLAIDPRTVNDWMHQKTLGMNDFYLGDGRGGPPLGNIQLLGRVSGADPEGRTSSSRRNSLLNWVEPSRRRLARDERGPSQSRKPRHARRRGGFGWTGNAATGARIALVAELRERLRAAGYPDRAVAAVRPAHAVASMRHRAHRRRSRRRRRSIRSAAPTIIPICSWSTPRSCRPRRRSIRR